MGARITWKVFSCSRTPRTAIFVHFTTTYNIFKKPKQAIECQMGVKINLDIAPARDNKVTLITLEYNTKGPKISALIIKNIKIAKTVNRLKHIIK